MFKKLFAKIFVLFGILSWFIASLFDENEVYKGLLLTINTYKKELDKALEKK